MILDFTQPLTINALNTHRIEKQLKVGLTSGCWDLTHYYHLRFWERCKRCCDILLVGVDDDHLVRSTKGKDRPIYHEGHRLRLVEHSRFVDAVFLMHDVSDFAKMSELIHPNFIFKNQAFNEIKILGSEFAQEVIIINDVEEKMSTTEFIKTINGNKQGE